MTPLSGKPAGLVRSTHGVSPRISVALCTYNGARYLDAQLRSIAEQTLIPSELVVSDDGSTDDTAAIVAEFGRTAPFPVRFHRQPTNLGVTRNFAAALALCQGELIALCDQDDVWLPDKLLSCANFLQAHPECLAVFTDATVTDESLRPFPPPSSLWERLRVTKEILKRIRSPDTSLQALTPYNSVTGATVVIRQELLRYTLPIPEPLPEKMIHDGWIAAVAGTLGRLDFLEAPTILYRQHPGQQVGLIKEAVPRQSFKVRREKFLPLAVNFERLHSALLSRVAQEAMPGALEGLADRAAHFRRRGTFSALPLRRMVQVVGEWKRGGYHRYCRHPLLAALRDTLF